MKRFIALVPASVCSMIGWWIGARVGLMTAFWLGTIGSGIGYYFGLRFTREYLP